MDQNILDFSFSKPTGVWQDNPRWNIKDRIVKKERLGQLTNELPSFIGNSVIKGRSHVLHEDPSNNLMLLMLSLLTDYGVFNYR